MGVGVGVRVGGYGRWGLTGVGGDGRWGLEWEVIGGGGWSGR